MPAFRREGGNNSRGGRGGARGGARAARGGPRLPFTLTEELGLPSQKKKEYSRPYDRQEEGRFDRRPQNGSRPTSNGAAKRSSISDREPERPAKRMKEHDKPAVTTVPSSQQAVASPDEIFIPAPRSSASGERKKITASTSTPLSRMLASQKGGNKHVAAESEEDEDEAVETEAEESRSKRTASDAKGKKLKKTAPVSDAPLDPSIMDSAFGSGRGKKAERDEEQEIAWLEWKLGKKGAKKPTDDGDESDGLDDLLNFADSVAFGKASKSKGKGKEIVSAFDSEDENMDGFSDMDDDEGSMMSFGSGEEDMEEEEEEDDLLSDAEDVYDGDDLDESMGSMEEDDDLAQFLTEDENDESEDEELKRNTEQNARTVDSEPVTKAVDAPAPAAIAAAPTAGKYIPPSLRKLQQQATAEASPSTEIAATVIKSTEQQPKTEQQIKLERKTQGLLNKLSEANIESILAEVEGLYRERSRNEVTTTLTDMIIKIISDRANLLDSFVILYATFVAALYKLKGADLGGQFLQTAVHRYSTTKEAAMVHSNHKENDTESPEDPGKQPLNILTLISELYNFQVVSCLLIYDLIKGFIEDLGTSGPKGEFAVEGVLRVLRCSGPQLRSDDPAALRDIVTLVQDKVSGHESKLSARAKFMIETLTNIKNNKVKNLPGGQGQVASETTTKMKKFLGGLSRNRQVMAHEPLRVTLNDILTASTKGKWWIVGAAWAGDPVRERERERARQAALKQASEGKQAGSKREADEDVDDETDLIGLGIGQQDELLRLARKQGMNTDVRRQVFMVMMTSDDFTHACDRLASLKFTEVQQREFIRVALHCLAIEPTYNPYYALLLSHLTSTSYSHRFTLQYALWDFLRDLGQDEVGGEGTRGDVRGTSGFAGLDEGKGGKALGKVKRVGMGLGWVISQGGVDLTVFKPVDFTSLQPASKVFFRTMFFYLVLGLYTRSPGFTLTAKQRAKRVASTSTSNTTKAQKQRLILSEDEKETIEAIFVKTISAGGMELAQGTRYLLTREMGITAGSSQQGRDEATGKNKSKNKASATSGTSRRFEKLMDDLEVEDEGYRGIVWEGLGVAEEVLGKMM